MHQNATGIHVREIGFTSQKSPEIGNSATLAVSHAMKMPVVGLSLRPRLYVAIKPLSRLRKGRNSMRLAAPHANHRDQQKDGTGRLEQDFAKLTPADRTYNPQDRRQHEDDDVQRQRLRRMKAHSHFRPRGEKQLEE